MLGDMGLIHMNGRVQDAVTGRFLSPDPTIPDPGFTQSFNRYSYVNNNPLSFTDPSGFVERCLDLQFPIPYTVPVVNEKTGDEGVGSAYHWDDRHICFDVPELTTDMVPVDPGGGGGGNGPGGTPSTPSEKPADSAVDSKSRDKRKPQGDDLRQCLASALGTLSSSPLDANDIGVATGEAGVELTHHGVESAASASTKSELQTLGSVAGGRNLSLAGQQETGRALSALAKDLAPAAKAASTLAGAGATAYDFFSHLPEEGPVRAGSYAATDLRVTYFLAGGGLPGIGLAVLYNYSGGSRTLKKAGSGLAATQTCNQLYGTEVPIIP
jgi:RHS repeat-associated protein